MMGSPYGHRLGIRIFRRARRYARPEAGTKLEKEKSYNLWPPGLGTDNA